MARRDHHSRLCTELTQRKTQLGRRAWASEQVGLTPQLRPSTRDEFREVTRKMADVMGDDQASFRVFG